MNEESLFKKNKKTPKNFKTLNWEKENPCSKIRKSKIISHRWCLWILWSWEGQNRISEHLFGEENSRKEKYGYASIWTAPCLLPRGLWLSPKTLNQTKESRWYKINASIMCSHAAMRTHTAKIGVAKMKLQRCKMYCTYHSLRGSSKGKKWC